MKLHKSYLEEKNALKKVLHTNTTMKDLFCFFISQDTKTVL